MSTSTSSSHQDADATLTDLNESTGAGGVSAEADASTSDDQHQHYSGGSALAGAKQPDPSGAGGTQAAPQPSPDDYRNLRKSLLETRAILRTAADAFAVLASSRHFLVSHNDSFHDTLKDAINQLRVDIDDFAAIGKPMLLGMQKRQSDGNTLLSAAALLFASTVAGVGNSILFSTRGDSSNVSTRAVQILWTISLSLSIVTALIAATAAYWNSDMWGVRKALSVERKLSESVNKHQDPALSDTTQSDTEPDGLKRRHRYVHFNPKEPLSH
ncbi:unnamed protein product [Tilletia caries]|nr:unnamed protein product [Tilletia caries]